jgi:hypothetical protein
MTEAWTKLLVEKVVAERGGPTSSSVSDPLAAATSTSEGAGRRGIAPLNEAVLRSHLERILRRESAHVLGRVSQMKERTQYIKNW